MSKVTVVFHSGSGHTLRLAQAVARGARSVEDAEVRLVPVAEVEQRWSELDDADALVFGAPTYMGSASAAFKSFMDSTGGRWMQQSWKDKLAAGFTNSGSPAGDKLATLQQFATFAMQHGMLWVGLGLLPGAMLEDREQNRFGTFLGATAQSPHGAPESEAPPAGDLRTGEALGRRVALAARRWTTREARPEPAHA